MKVGTQLTKEQQTDVRPVEPREPLKRKVFSCAVQDKFWKLRQWKLHFF